MKKLPNYWLVNGEMFSGNIFVEIMILFLSVISPEIILPETPPHNQNSPTNANPLQYSPSISDGNHPAAT